MAFMKIYTSEWLALSEEIKLKLIRLAVLENQNKHKNKNPLLQKANKGYLISNLEVKGI